MRLLDRWFGKKALASPKGQDMPMLGRLGARQWPPKPHKFPITFSLGNETVGMLKSIDVKLVRLYQEIVAKSRTQAEKGEFHWVCDHVRSFDLSFYVPMNVMSLPHQKIRNVLIMLNGLNEIAHVHYSHYDRIGVSLASGETGAALFPTPFHLNRAAYLEERFKAEYKKRSGTQPWPRAPGAPSMMRYPHKGMLRHPEAPFYCFKQISKEVSSFAEYLRRSRTAKAEDEFVDTDSCDDEFYDYLFDWGNLRISLLGYSLGGLQALFTFLGNPGLFDHCVLVNSGASLDDLKVKPVHISDSEWKQIKKGCHDIQHNLPPDIGQDERNLLNDVLFNRPFTNEQTAKVFRQNAHKLFFIAGGADIVSPAEYLLQFLKGDDVAGSTFRGLNILQAEGLGHPLQRSLDYDRWFPVIISTIKQFIHSPDPTLEPVSYDDVLDWFLSFKVENTPWDDWCQTASLLDARGDQNLNVARIVEKLDQEKRREFQRYYLVSKRYFENDSELLRTLERRRR